MNIVNPKTGEVTVLTKEQEAILADIESEQEEILADIQAEQEAILADIESEQEEEQEEDAE